MEVSGMLYRKIRVSQLDDTKKLYRVMFVPEEITLFHLAQVLIRTFRGYEGALYSFIGDGFTWIPGFRVRNDHTKLMGGSHLEDPGSAYKFLYDLDDAWEFEVRLSNETRELDSELPVIVTEGKGAGVWQDEHEDYMRLLSAVYRNESGLDEMFDLPYNLDIETVAETFDEINPALETSILAEDPYPGETDDESYTIWTVFNEIYNDARIGFMTGNDGKIWLEAWEEFRKVCTQLREEDRLPDSWDDLCMENPNFDGDDLITDLAEELPDYGLCAQLWQIMNEAENMFEADDDEFVLDIFYGKWEALKGLGRYEELMRLSKDMYRKYPYENVTRVDLLEAYKIHGMYDEGMTLIRKVLEEDDNECNEDNLNFFEKAADFAYKAGDKELGAWLTKVSDDEFDREQGEPDEYFTMTEQEKAMNAELLARLRKACEDYSSDGKPDRIYLVITELTLLLINGGEVYVPFKPGINGGIGMAAMDDGRHYLTIYTDEHTELPGGQEIRSIPLVRLLTDFFDETVDGIIIDPGQYGNYLAVISSDVVELIKEEAGIYDDYDEDDEDDIDW